MICSSQRKVDTAFSFGGQLIRVWKQSRRQTPALGRRKWTGIRLEGLLPVLLGRQVAEAAHRAFFVEEPYVFRGGGDVLRVPDVEVDEHLGLRPSVYRLHGPVVRGCSYPRGGPHDIIGQKHFVECLRRVHRALIRVECGSQFGVLFFHGEESGHAVVVGRRVAFPAR